MGGMMHYGFGFGGILMSIIFLITKEEYERMKKDLEG